MIHYITVQVNAHATEDEDRVRTALDLFLLNSCEIGKCTNTDKYIDVMIANGHYGNPIVIFRSTIKKKTDTKKFARFISCNLSEADRECLHRQMPQRLDDSQTFHLRFDKQAAYNGSVKLSSSSDAIIVKIKIETYPKDRLKAGRIVEDLFG